MHLTFVLHKPRITVIAVQVVQVHKAKAVLVAALSLPQLDDALANACFRVCFCVTTMSCGPRQAVDGLHEAVCRFQMMRWEAEKC